MLGAYQTPQGSPSQQGELSSPYQNSTAEKFIAISIPEGQDVESKEFSSEHEVESQTSKSWFVVAMVIGGLMVVGTGFGTLGLLHTYGITLPQFLQPMASAIGSIGQEALWGLTAGGGAIGISLFVWGAYKLYKDPTRFGDRFAEWDVYKPNQKGLGQKGMEKTCEIAYRTKTPSTIHLRRCKPGGALECTGPLTQKQLNNLITNLVKDGYKMLYL